MSDKLSSSLLSTPCRPTNSGTSNAPDSNGARTRTREGHESPNRELCTKLFAVGPDQEVPQGAPQLQSEGKRLIF